MNSIHVPTPEFKSELTELIFELEHQRNRSFRVTTPPWLFFDLKEVMHILESLTSARIEGNRTTLLSVVENVISGEKTTKDESLVELKNIDEAITFIEENIHSTAIDRAFICELHRITTKNLVDQGSRTPGVYRSVDVRISNAKHTPPHHVQVPELMRELIEFINQESQPQEHLLRVAVAHHRMAAIHPFDDGNGRTVRLVTYAMLAKFGFIDKKGFRLLNPSAIFCINRQQYYDMLEKADLEGEQGLLEWSLFVLRGISEEVRKIDILMSRQFAEKNLLGPALDLALEKKQISDIEYEVLKVAMKKDVFQAKDIEYLLPAGSSRATQVSRILKRMRDQKFIMVHPDYKLKYVLRFSNNYLLRGVIQQMAAHKLLPVSAEN